MYIYIYIYIYVPPRSLQELLRLLEPSLRGRHVVVLRFESEARGRPSPRRPSNTINHILFLLLIMMIITYESYYPLQTWEIWRSPAKLSPRGSMS